MRSVSHRVATVAAAVAFLALWLVPGADALRLISPSGDPAIARYQRWVDAAAMPMPSENLYVVLASCPVPVSDGCIVHDAVPTVYLGPMVRDRATLLHEVGHAFDAAEMTDASRAAFSAIFGDTRAWDVGPNGYQTGNFPPGWAEWNGRYRDDMRSYWKGDGGLLPAFASGVLASSSYAAR